MRKERRTLKRILAKLLVFALVFQLVVPVNLMAAPVEQDGFVIDTVSENGITKKVVTDYVGTATDIVIPDGVTAIAAQAFSGCTTIRTVDLNDVEEIGDMAFYQCQSIESIDLKKVTKLGTGVFSYCLGLDELIFPRVESLSGEAAVLDAPVYVHPDFPITIQIYIPKELENFSFRLLDGAKGVIVEDGHPTYKSVDGALYAKESDELLWETMYKTESEEEIDKVEGVTMIAPNYTNTKTVNLYGYGFSKETEDVDIMCAESVLATVNPDAKDRWSAQVELPVTDETTSFVLYAKMGDMRSEEVTIVYQTDSNIVLPKVTDAFCHHYSWYSVNLEKGMSKTMTFTDAGAPVLQVEYTIEDDEQIEQITCVTDGTKSYPVKKVEETGKWVVQIPLNPDGTELPKCIELECDLGEITYVPSMFEIPWIIDPSGYIYEAVPENRVEGAQMTIYYKASEDADDVTAVLWGAEPYYQSNPIMTDENGKYAWDVPEGWWQVVAEKDGYETTKSEWLKVPPAQTEVNLELVSTQAPLIAPIELSSDKMKVQFDKYVKVDTVTDRISLRSDDEDVAFSSITAVNPATRGEDTVATIFEVTFENALDASKTYEASFADGIESYAGINMGAGAAIGLKVTGIVTGLEVQETMLLEKGKEYIYEVTVTADENLEGRKVSVTSSDESVVKATESVWTDANGKASIVVEGCGVGSVQLTFAVDDTTVSKTVNATVFMDAAVMEEVQENSGVVIPEGGDITGGTEPGGENSDFVIETVNENGVSKRVLTAYLGSDDEVSIPEGVEVIGADVFMGCKSLKEIDLTNVTSIEPDAFFGCTSLEKVTFGAGLTSIRSGAFENCVSLKEINIPATEDLVIEAEGFSGCSGIESIQIAASKIDIKNKAFNGVKKCDMSLSGPSGGIILDDGAFAGLQVNELHLDGKFIERYSSGEDAEAFVDGSASAFDNISNTYYVDMTNVSYSRTDASKDKRDFFSTMAGINPGGKIVFCGDLTNLETAAFILGGPGVTAFEVEEEAGKTYGYQAIDGVLYKENENGLTAIWAPQGLVMEDGLCHIAEGTTEFAPGFFINNWNYSDYRMANKITNIALPKSMTEIKDIVPENYEHAVTVYLPEDGDTKYHVSSIFVEPDVRYRTGVALPSSLENYTWDAGALSSIDEYIIPAEMTEFPSKLLLENMFSLDKIVVEEGNTAFKVVDGAIYSADGKVLYWWPITNAARNLIIEIPEGVEVIKPYALGKEANTSSTKYDIKIILPSTLKEVEKDAVYNRCSDVFHVYANRCSEDVKVGPLTGYIHYLYVDNPETSPFAEAWKEVREGGNVSGALNIISGGVARIKANVGYEAEDGTTKKAAVGSYQMKLSKVSGSTVTSVDSSCIYHADGTIELLLAADGLYRVEFVPLQSDVYMTKTLDDVELKVVSPDQMTENSTTLDVTIERLPVLKVNAEEGVWGYVFDKDGNYLSDLSTRSYGLISKGLQAGDYKVLLHKSSGKLMKQNKLSDYASLGLVEDTDYVVEDFTIAAFTESTADVTIDAPDFAQATEKDGFLKLDECSYTAASSVSAGFTNLDITYAIDSEKWDASAQNVTILVTLPQYVDYVKNSAYYVTESGTQIEACTVAQSGYNLRFTLDKDSLEGRIRFSLLTSPGYGGISCAFVEGAATDFIGAVEILKSELTINVADQFSKGDTIRVSGLAPAGNTVQLFVGNKKMADVVANERGAWGTQLSVDDAQVGESYVVIAKVQQNKTVGTAYDEVTCVEKAIKVTNIEYEYHHHVPSKFVDSEVDMNTMMGKRYIETALSKCWLPFNVYVDIENDENIQQLFLTFDRGNGREYQDFNVGNNGRWELYSDVKVDGLPSELKLVAQVKDGDEVKEVDICDFIIEWIIDPSGYIYEAVPENRVEDATVTVYYKDSNGMPQKWDAEKFGQRNSVVTGNDGYYGWFVPKGQWKVVAEKDGYKKAESSWLTVPPAQFNVNLELVSTKQPVVKGIDLAKDKMLVHFDNYVLVSSMSKDKVALAAGENAVEIASIEAVDAKQRNSKSIAKEFVVTFASSLAEGTYAATVAAGVKSYADVAMSEAQTVGDLTVAGIVKDITTPEFFVTKAGKDCIFEVSVVSDGEVNGRLLTATSADESKVKVVNTTAADAEGKAAITLNGPAMTVTEITLGVENSSFSKTVSVMVVENDAVFDKMFELNDLTKPQIPDEEEDVQEPEDPSVSDNDVPKDPTEPEEPSDPTEPEDPSDPTEPEDPSDPTEPEDPSDPTEPEDPSDPTEPEDPSDPTEPEEPSDPTEPEDPSDPTEPEDPKDPTEPEDPSDPTEPEDPKDPTEPEDPSEPVEPSVSDNDVPKEPTVSENNVPADLAKAVVTGIVNKVYTGRALTQDVKVTVDGKTLVNYVDYTVAYKNNTEAGTAQAIITGKGNYKGTKTVTFTIEKAATILKAESTVYKKAYGAKAFTVKVTGATGAVTYSSSDAKVAKVNASGKVSIKNTGRAVITASVAESKNYKAGKVEIVIEVSPKKASIKTLASKKAKQLTVTWKKDKKATGYEVTYSTSKKFKKSMTKTVLVKKTKTTKTTLKNLKKGKTYYVKVRAYKEVKVNGKKVKIYSPYSKVLKKKVK